MGSGGAFVPNASVHAELDYALPRDPVKFRSLVEEWFVDAVRNLGGDDLAPLADDLDLSGRGAVLRKSGVPYGRPGELWGSLWTTRVSRGRRTRSGKAWSPKAWAFFLQELETEPLGVSVGLARLGADGYPGGPWLRIAAERDFEAPDWVRLMVHRSAEEFFAPERSVEIQRRWTDFLHRRLEAQEQPCLFGCLTDDIETTTYRTALEASLGLFPDETLPEHDTVLRGYSWITVCSPGVAHRLGGADALRASGAFTDVTGLADGGLLLRATDDMRTYTADRIAEVFQQVRAVLPPGKPVGGLSETVPRLVFLER
ncbi:hypothetical protein [Streptomyces sp. NPDC094049]|uniref:hypothetical protein n=1 Tax=Streptomyces sp. NPDC094049 TaxID=3154987 RepID=UPI00332A8961